MKGEGIEVDLDVKLTERGTWPGLREEKGVKVLEGAELAAIWTTEDSTRALGTVVAMRIDLGGGRVAIAEETLSSFLNCAGKVRAYYEPENKVAMTSEAFANYKALGAMLHTPSLKEAFEAGIAEIERLRSALDAGPSTAPVPMLLWCPQCSERHIDIGEFATRPHHTHACQDCGMVWRPALVPTVGVYFLPGFKNEEPPDSGEEMDAHLANLKALVAMVPEPDLKEAFSAAVAEIERIHEGT